jgi:hypothetical protein
MKFKIWKIGLPILVALGVCFMAYHPMVSQLAASPLVKRELAQSVLVQTGIANQYDMYLGNSAESLVGAGINAKLVSWIQQLFAREAGWKQMEPQYIARMEASFSEPELQELLTLFQKPLLQKLLQMEAQTYAETSSQRRLLFSKVWDAYNSGKFNPPADVLK